MKKPIGVLLAAGRGRRAGGLKQLLPWPTSNGEIPLVAASFDAIAGFCQQMVVVRGWDQKIVEDALGPRSFESVTANSDAPMSNSILVGLRAAQAIDGNCHVLLQPADQPRVRSETLCQLTEHAMETTEVLLPTFDGRTGHPILLVPDFVNRILHDGIVNGLNQFIKSHASRCRRIEVDDAHILSDIDTLDDYESLRNTKID